MGRNREADTRVALGIGKADPEASEPRGGIERHLRNALLGLAREGLLGALGFPVRPFHEAVAHHPDAGGGDFDFSKAKQNFGEPVPTFQQHWRIDGLRRLLRRSRRFTGPNRLDIIQHVFDILTARRLRRSEAHTSELQSLMRTSYAVSF